MKKLLYLSLVIATTFIVACKHDPIVTEVDKELISLVSSRAKDGTKEFFILPESDDYENIPQDPRNKLNAAKVELGKMLFYETGVGLEAQHQSGSFTYSCATCHIPSAGFRPGVAQGIADGAYGFGDNGEGRFLNSEYEEDELDAQGARPLSMLNVAYVTNSMWNGSFGPKGVNEGTEHLWGLFDPTTVNNFLGYEALEAQIIEGLHTHRMVYNENTVKTYKYDAYFDAAFPEMDVETRYSREAAALALAAYLRTLFANEAPFQHWLKGDKSALSMEQKRGGVLFFGKAGCWRCHYEKNLGSMEFHALGVKDLYENGGLNTSENDRRNLGRGGFTGNSADMYKFRVPQLYNMGDAGFYFHGGSKETLPELIEYFNNGVPENENVNQENISEFFHPLNLTASEMKDLEAFLRDGLRDPNINRYVPENVLSGMCFPNNDTQSQVDLGCQ